MVKDESDLTSAMSLYLRKVKKKPLFLTRPYAVEYKFLKKGRLNFNSDLRPQQIPSLLDAKSSVGIYHKISDQSQGAKPFDAIHLANVEAWMAVGIGESIYYLDCETVDKDIKSGLKSYTTGEIKEKAIYIINYTKYE